jgi:hypothetical protein
VDPSLRSTVYDCESKTSLARAIPFVNLERLAVPTLLVVRGVLVTEGQRIVLG